jgi:hypothetical protein
VSPQGTFGNVGRNTMLTPHFQSIDMALAKNFTMPYSERHVIQFRLEAFQRLQPSFVGCAERQTSWQVRHFLERPPIRASGLRRHQLNRHSRCARFNWD